MEYFTFNVAARSEILLQIRKRSYRTACAVISAIIAFYKYIQYVPLYSGLLR